MFITEVVLKKHGFFPYFFSKGSGFNFPFGIFIHQKNK